MRTRHHRPCQSVCSQRLKTIRGRVVVAVSLSLLATPPLVAQRKVISVIRKDSAGVEIVQSITHRNPPALSWTVDQRPRLVIGGEESAMTAFNDVARAF